MNFIDIFSGAGGLSCGLEMEGFSCILGIDHNKHAIDTFAANHSKAKTFCGDIKELSKKKLNEYLGNKKIDLVVGGPPCQGFSTVGPGNPKDERNTLFLEYLRIVKITDPRFVVIENVTGLLAKKNEKTLAAIFKKFEKMGFVMDVRVLSAEKFGVPEKRRRTILIGSKINDEILFPIETHDIQKGNYYYPAETVGSALKGITKRSKLANHDVDAAAISNKEDRERISCIPEGKGIRYEKDELAYLPKKLRLGVDWSQIRENRFRQTKYLRLDRKKPSPTIMTHRHSYYHPTADRYLTQREAARLQSFPDSFIFSGPLSAQWKQIGNAVPPLLGKAIGKAIKKMVKESKKKRKTLDKSKTTDLIQKERKSAFVYKVAK